MISASTGPWTCFHCDETFTEERAALLHFGPHEQRRPACLVKASEGGLLEALRRAESDAEHAWSAVHAESAEGIKAFQANLGRHHMALRSAEEGGYERGMADMQQSVEQLRRILHRYGDRVRMANCHRPDWQQEIDEAMAWVADHPEPEEAR